MSNLEPVNVNLVSWFYNATMTTDLVMAAFQLGACIFLLPSIIVLARDGELKGVSLWSIGYFTFWTIFSTWNWVKLEQPYSFGTSALMLLVYCVWFLLAVSAKRRQP